MMAFALMLVLAGLGIGFITATLYALRHWNGGWRWLAAVPLLFVVAAVLKIMLDVRIDPTAHNLWPFELLATSAIASIALGVCYIVRIFTRQRMRNSES